MQGLSTIFTSCQPGLVQGRNRFWDEDGPGRPWSFTVSGGWELGPKVVVENDGSASSFCGLVLGPSSRG